MPFPPGPCSPSKQRPPIPCLPGPCPTPCSKVKNNNMKPRSRVEDSEDSARYY
jgi:hypothetical protein